MSYIYKIDTLAYTYSYISATYLTTALAPTPTIKYATAKVLKEPETPKHSNTETFI